MRDNLLDVLMEDLLQQRGGPCKVQFVVRERTGEQNLNTPPPPPPTKNIEPIAERRPIQLNLNPKYSFESFVINPSNQFTVATYTAIANLPGKAYNPLFLYGSVDLNKT